ncbi:MAG: Gfo/Idh/MocA family oxidoreductase [Anaerolineae bacterium]|nr:Gfo/Idh/MocA family oxidoreductase [Anaerolineae bacterium]
MIRTGLLGYGLAGRSFHAPFLRVLPDFELVVVASSRQAEAAATGAEVVPDAATVIARDDLDLIVVATPHRLHVEQAQAALAAGKHVVVEKPVTDSVAEAQALLQAAEAAGKLVIPYQNRRWDGDFLTVQALVRSGVLGKLHFSALNGLCIARNRAASGANVMPRWVASLMTWDRISSTRPCSFLGCPRASMHRSPLTAQLWKPTTSSACTCTMLMVWRPCWKPMC